MTMLEAMARGMASAGWIDSEDDLDKVWASDPSFREGFLEFARLGLEAIRQPEVADLSFPSGTVDGWTAMVDAVLEGQA